MSWQDEFKEVKQSQRLVLWKGLQKVTQTYGKVGYEKCTTLGS